jgi:crossover junction endodeoxyribonuclease RusA
VTLSVVTFSVGEPAARFTVPIPPSANTLFVNIAGQVIGGATRAKGKTYRAWATQAGWEIKRQRVPYFDRPVRVLIEMDIQRNHDIDNRIKPILDVLQNTGVLQNDNLVDDLRIVRAGSKKEATISIWPLRIASEAAE